MPDPTLVFFVAAVIIAIGAASSHLFRRTGIPDMLFLVLLGVVVGPVLGLITIEDIAYLTPYLAVLALVVILFDGGLNMSVHKVMDEFPRAIMLAIIGFIISVVTVTLFAQFLLGFKLLEGALLGAILGGSSSIVVIATAQRHFVLWF